MKHTLTITEDAAYAARIRAEGGDDAEVRADAWSWAITCPHDPDNRLRSCQSWMECCLTSQMTAEELDQLIETGEGPCSVSPTGRHDYVPNDWFSVGYPSRACYLQVGEDVGEEIRQELLPKLSPGEHHIDMGWDFYGSGPVIFVSGSDEEGSSSGDR